MKLRGGTIVLTGNPISLYEGLGEAQVGFAHPAPEIRDCGLRAHTRNVGDVLIGWTKSFRDGYMDVGSLSPGDAATLSCENLSIDNIYLLGTEGDRIRVSLLI